MYIGANQPDLIGYISSFLISSPSPCCDQVKPCRSEKVLDNPERGCLMCAQHFLQTVLPSWQKDIWLAVVMFRLALRWFPLPFFLTATVYTFDLYVNLGITPSDVFQSMVRRETDTTPRLASLPPGVPGVCIYFERRRHTDEKILDSPHRRQRTRNVCLHYARREADDISKICLCITQLLW